MYSIDLQYFKASISVSVSQVFLFCLLRINFLYIRLRPLEKRNRRIVLLLKKTEDFQDVVVSEVIPSDVKLNEITDGGVTLSNNNSS